MRTTPISDELLKIKNKILQDAIDYGLDFYEVIFEVCDYDTINILAAQGGFPARYPHWRFGMDYDQLSKGYSYGMQKIYEMVINTDPCYAYLLKANHLVDQKIVMAHVYGHADFFKNNAWFKGTDRKMMDVMANHGTKIRRYMELYGQESVETFIDYVLSLENLIDPSNLFETQEVKRGRDKIEQEFIKESESDPLDDERSRALKSFMKNKKKSPEGEESQEAKDKIRDQQNEKFPKHPARDIMEFLLHHAPLKEWQADIMAILREEAYYFLPQRMSKIMNEGWASYWHSRIMTERVLGPNEIIDFADHHAGVMQMSKKQINPYKIGIELYRDIEFRWNTGRFGKDYNECNNLRDKDNWNTNLMKGKEKIFEVRSTHNDIGFIDEFFTQEFCERQQLFTYKYNPRSGKYEIDNRDFLAIKQKLLSQLTNFGQPVIVIEDANYANRGELLLRHSHFGVDLDLSYAADTLRNIYKIWRRPVNIVTRYEEKEVLFHFDGKEMKPLH